MVAESGIPDAVELGDEAVGDVGVAEDESCFFGYDLHGEVPLGYEG